MKDEKENMSLVDRVAIVVEVYGAVCQLYLMEHEAWKLCGHCIFRHVLLYIVENARHDTEFGREGLIMNDLSFFSA